MNKLIEEIYEPWLPDKFQNLEVTDLKVIYGGELNSVMLEIQLWHYNKPSQQVIIKFFELPVAIRVTNESQRLKTLDKIQNVEDSIFYFVRNSDFISWLNYESLGIYENDPWIHIAITTTEDWIDIITADLPIVTRKAE